MFIEDLSQNQKINRIDDMIEKAQVNYIANVGANSKKGFQSYKQFINRMEGKKHITQNKISQTVWDKIKRQKERGVK